MELLEAEARQVFDPIGMTFNYGKKKATDLQENKSVKLPSPSDPHVESSIEIIKNKVMEVFRDYKNKYCNKNGQQKSKLSKSEKQVYSLQNFSDKIKIGLSGSNQTNSSNLVELNVEKKKQEEASDKDTVKKKIT